MSQVILNYILKNVSKRLSIGSYSKNGRNHFGRICVFHRGGGKARRYRIVDYYRRLNFFGFICKIIYDANRTSFLGLIFYENGIFSYIVLSDKLMVGAKLYSGFKFLSQDCYFVGSALPLRYIPLFEVVNNIEFKPGKGASLSRSAGCGAIVVAKSSSKITLKLRSGWVSSVSTYCMAVLGYVSHMSYIAENIGKAGKNRGKGIRPTVRGVAMNPCDHPHGGGNGKTSPPSAPVSPWGRMTKGPHTKNTKIDKLKRKLFKQVR